VTAVDLSEGMLTQAREAVSSSNVDFVHADASRFEAETPYDLAMSVRVLEYVPEWDTIIARLRHLVRPGGRAVVITKTPVSVYRGTGRERWFGPRTLPRLLAGRQLDPNFWQRHIPVRKMVAGFRDAGFTGIKVRPVIFGLPIFMRGTKQYPIVPSFAERPFLWSFEQAWGWASAGGETRRLLSLVFSESYAVSGLRSES
jgi:ubiquinone/menaquinone biosynthesis C-methylase UbiE